MTEKRIGTYAAAMRQANREAKATCAALAAIVVVWIVGGFGLANSGIEFFHTPLWVFGGCVLPWIAAIVAAVVLSRRVFRDFDLDEVARMDAEGATPQAPNEAAARGESSCSGACFENGMPRIAGDGVRPGRAAQGDEGGK